MQQQQRCELRTPTRKAPWRRRSANAKNPAALVKAQSLAVLMFEKPDLP